MSLKGIFYNIFVENMKNERYTDLNEGISDDATLVGALRSGELFALPLGKDQNEKIQYSNQLAKNYQPFFSGILGYQYNLSYNFSDGSLQTLQNYL